MKQFILFSPVAPLRITHQQDTVYKIDFLEPDITHPQGDKNNRIADALLHYFENPLDPIALSFQLEGTVFQKKIWQSLMQIPLGKTRTYAELAAQLKTGARAVGQACRKNPIPLIVPCHRVIAKNGLGGFAGQTTGFTPRIKMWLLRHECAELGCSAPDSANNNKSACTGL